MASERTPHTVCYKTIKTKSQSVAVLYDAYLPRSLPSEGGLLPAVVYFHGGGVTVGNRTSWFPTWLYERVMSLGFIFISADYQLLPAGTGYEIAEDMKDLFTFLGNSEMKGRDEKLVKIDVSRIAVSGSSGGGLCAYLASIHCSPRPKALVNIYGMGGDMLTKHYLELKTEVFDRKRELLDPADFKEFLYPYGAGSLGLVPVTDSPLAYHPQTYRIPGYPANPRMLLCRLFIQLGTFLDYWTGVHEPSLSAALMKTLGEAKDEHRDETVKALASLIPEKHREIFPQLKVDSQWPPTVLLHGTVDSAVHYDESVNMKNLLEQAGVPVELIGFEGKEHSFDYDPKAEELFSHEFDKVKMFLQEQLGQ